MPKLIEKGRREELKLNILRLLSINGRMSFNEMAKRLRITKQSAYHLFLETVEEYDLHFVPELNIEELWKYEFLKLTAHKSTKKEMREETIEKLPEIGLTEYIILLKFIGKVPDNEKIIKLLSNSYMPQFVAKLHGEYDLVIYALTRDYARLNKFLVDFRKQLGKTPLRLELNAIETTFGFFPLRSELLKGLNISESYCDLLLGLNDDGRQGIKEIAKKFRRRPELLGYAMDRLKRTEMLRRITYYEGKPRNVVSTIIQINIIDEFSFFEVRNKWFLDLVSNYERTHNEYIFIGDISNPQGGLIFANFENDAKAEEFVENLKKKLKGVEIRYMHITKILLGYLGIRNFDPRYSEQYQILEKQKLVPIFNRRYKEKLEIEKEENLDSASLVKE